MNIFRRESRDESRGQKAFARKPFGSRLSTIGPRPAYAALRRGKRAFSLLEVMIAIAILCVGTFAILDLISSSLANARRLQRPLIDGSAVLAIDVATNKLIEGVTEGNMGDLLGKNYSDYRWTKNIVEVQSNKLFQVDVYIQRNGSRDIVARTATLLYKPDSPPGMLDGGGGLIH